ncbi:hypothetical protein OROHE_002685 [Orobanche hederae]
MEGGGERKRKAGIELDWSKLLPLNDDEPPPTVVREASVAEKRKPRTADVMILGEEDESDSCVYLQNISDTDLTNKIDRAKKMLGQSFTREKLRDDGKKLQANLRRLEVEKANRKCKKATTLADKSTFVGATDDLASHGVPTSVSASQSEFASRFCSILDDKRPTKSFTEELSTLNRCDSKRANIQFLAQRTNKIGLSSRQAPFKSPNYLSVHTNDSSQSNGEHFRSHSRSPSPRRPDKDFSDFLEKKKENVQRHQPMRNTKRNNQKTVVLVDEEELEVDAVSQIELVGQSNKETTIYYPSRNDPEAVEICYSDMECLAPESYLSSTIMNFYIRYLQKLTSPRTAKRCDYHFFSTYFYKKLKQDVFNKVFGRVKSLLMDKETYMKFRRCLHWSLIIICIPNKEDDSGPIILHLDSLGLHFSKSIFSDVKSFLVEEWKFLRQEELLPELPIPDNVWDKLSRRIDEKVIEVPQQRNEYDCGLFVLFFMERFLEVAPERLKKEDLDMFGKQWFRPEEASGLRINISNILKEEFENACGATCKLDR